MHERMNIQLTGKKTRQVYRRRLVVSMPVCIACAMLLTGPSIFLIASNIDNLQSETNHMEIRELVMADLKKSGTLCNQSRVEEKHLIQPIVPTKTEIKEFYEERVERYEPLPEKTENKYNMSMLVKSDELNRIFTQDSSLNGRLCEKLVNNDESAIKRSYGIMLKKKRKMILNSHYIHWTRKCDQFKKSRGYFETPFTEEERDFPIAYSIVAYKQIEAVERFLRLIYRPQNYYCIHMDVKTSAIDLMTIKAIADCFPNVFLSTRSIDVKWGEFSVLEADLVCMEDLWKYPDWKYYINLTGQELPLKTNLELVRILKVMKWANLVDGTWIRARQNYFYRWTKNGARPPHRIRPIKGSLHIAVNRDFVDFALHDFRSKDFQKWLNNTEIPDETFFSSLNHNPHLGIPGSFLGEPEEYARKPTFTRYKNWEMGHGVWVSKCAGKYVRNICILGIGDLKALKDTIGLFVNKIDLDFEYMAYECVEEMLYNRTRNQYLYKEPIDTSFYESLDQVRYRLIVGKNFPSS